MKSMNDSWEFQEVESNHSGRGVLRFQSTSSDSKFSFYAEPRQTLASWTHGRCLDHRKTLVVANFLTFDSSRNHYQGIHSTTPGATGSVPVHIGTGTPVARDENRIRGTILMPTFARRPSTMSSFLLVKIQQNSMVGQQQTANIGTSNSTNSVHLLHFYVGRLDSSKYTWCRALWTC